jgi:hypothetical protein
MQGTESRCQHPDCYVAYPLGLKGVVVGRAIARNCSADVKSAIRFHIDTFGEQVFSDNPSVLRLSSPGDCRRLMSSSR